MVTFPLAYAIKNVIFKTHLHQIICMHYRRADVLQGIHLTTTHAF